MASRPGFEWVLFAQALSASGELFGQRLQRRFHKGSQIRSLSTTVVYSAVQAFVILAICELSLPQDVTKGQGSLWMWGALVRHPALLINAFNNTVYWVALAFVLREPLGVVLVVLAFLLAGFLVAPFETVVGISGDPGADWLAGVLAVTGAVMCLVDLPEAVASWADEAVHPLLVRCSCGAVRLPSESAGSAAGERTRSDSRSSGQEPEGQGLLARQDATTDDDEDDDRIVLGAAATSAVVPMTRVPDAERLGPEGAAASALHEPVRIQTSPAAVAFAWGVLAVTAGIGIVCTTYFEQEAGLGMFGYAAIDQVLLPFTTLPLLALATVSPALATALGEPETGRHQGVMATAAATWAEFDWPTLILFRAPMFGREFVFFWLVTAFSDLSTTYLQMTIVRIVMCWLLSLLVCTVLREWAGVSLVEAQKSMRASTLALRLLGTLVLILSYVRLQHSL